MMLIDWNTFKKFVQDRDLNIQGIETQDYYYLSAKDDYFLVTCEIFKNPTDTTDISDFETNFKPNWNKKIDRRDKEGNPVFRNVIAENSMLFQPRCIDFTTAKLNSICNKSSDLSDLGDAELHFFNESYEEITRNEGETDQQFQARLDSSCEFTWLYFTPNYRYAIKSGEIRYKGTLGDESDLWIEVAPHIPKAYGGSVPFINGGLPLDFFDEKKSIIIDGGTCAIIELDNQYLSHRLGVKVEHGIGIKIDILATFNIYR